jgi:hypothetical protein
VTNGERERERAMGKMGNDEKVFAAELGRRRREKVKQLARLRSETVQSDLSDKQKPNSQNLWTGKRFEKHAKINLKSI